MKNKNILFKNFKLDKKTINTKKIGRPFNSPYGIPALASPKGERLSKNVTKIS